MNFLCSRGKNNISRVSPANEWDTCLPREHKIHIFELTCNVLLLYKHTADDVFADFPKIPKIFQNCPEGQTNVLEHLPKISEGVRRLPKTFEEDPKMFR